MRSNNYSKKKANQKNSQKIIYVPKNIKENNNTNQKYISDDFEGGPDNWFSKEENEIKFKTTLNEIGNENERLYFLSYSYIDIHEKMLKDKVRTKTYMQAILDNKELFKDKIVLDVGCGTGILSIFAAQAGAKHVYGIENSDIYNAAVQIIKDNYLEDKITIIKGLVEKIELPIKKVDIIISEWMGFFLLYESMLDSVLFARDKWLKEGGIILPNHFSIHLAAIEDDYYLSQNNKFWENVYGVNMTCIKPLIFSEPIVNNVSKKQIITNNYKIFEIFDITKVKLEDLQFKSPFCLSAFRNSTVHGLVSWFDTFFDDPRLIKPYQFSTSPFTTVTHWSQVIFYTMNPIILIKDQMLLGQIAVRKSKKDHRSLDIKILFKYQNGNQIKKEIRLYKLQ